MTARDELLKEIKARNAVAAYFGKDGLQAPFGDAKVAALVDVNQISSAITQKLPLPAADNAQSDAFELISHLVEIGGLAVGGTIGSEFVHNAAKGLSAAFGLAAYLTKDNEGTPDLVGPEVTAKAAELGATLYERYRDASNYFTTEAQIVMSDWDKMQAVADARNTATWKLPDERTTTTQLDLATKQTIYQSLVPVAYPVLYDLGSYETGYHFDDARNWICKNPIAADQRLFQNTGPGAQVTWKVSPHSAYRTTFGPSDIVAVGAVRHVGSGKGAYVPAPPDTLTGTLFGDIKAGGVGFYKLQLYSPQNFKLFSTTLQQRYQLLITAHGFGYWWCAQVPTPPGT